MRLDQQLSLRQSQRLVMTPQLRQAVEILQLGAIELAEYLQAQALENPLLETDPDSLDQQAADPADGLGDAAEAAGTRDDGAAGGLAADELERWMDYFADSSDLGLPVTRASTVDLPDPIEAVSASGPTLAEHLHLQLSMLDLADSIAIRASRAVVEALDHDGYLRVGLEELAAAAGVGVLDIRRGLTAVQAMDPPGVAARDLRECLLLQLRARQPQPVLAITLVANHLEDIAAGRYRHLAQATGQTKEALQEALDEIRGLNPRPGSAFGGGPATRYIVPDVVVERVGSEYVVLLNDAAAPRLGINAYYRSLAASPEGLGAEAAAFLSERLRSAMWLLRCVEQRRSTVWRVAECIVEQQKEFLGHGIRHLKPMTLKDVAREIEVHESTVSRAVANKYVQTPQGAFELRFFFTSGVASAAGENTVSSASVKQVIKELIEAEDPLEPHSDQRLVELLRRRGATLSRRTVTKYRRELGVPSSAQRRRLESR